MTDPNRFVWDNPDDLEIVEDIQTKYNHMHDARGRFASRGAARGIDAALMSRATEAVRDVVLPTDPQNYAWDGHDLPDGGYLGPFQSSPHDDVLNIPKARAYFLYEEAKRAQKPTQTIENMKRMVPGKSEEYYTEWQESQRRIAAARSVVTHLSRQHDFFESVYFQGALALRKNAAEVLGRPLNKEFTDGMKNPKWPQDEKDLWDGMAGTMKHLQNADRAFTAAYVKKTYGDEITVYRGVGPGLFRAYPKAEKGSEVEIGVNALSSWSTDIKVAKEFASNQWGTVMENVPKGSHGAVLVKTQVKAEDVWMISDLSHDHLRKFRGQPGMEVVIGSPDPVQRVAVAAKVRTVSSEEIARRAEQRRKLMRAYDEAMAEYYGVY